MDQQQNLLLGYLIEDFETAYKNFMESEGLEDDAMTKTAFYAASDMIVRADPLPDRAVQAEFEFYLDSKRAEALRHHLEKIEKLLFAASAKRQQR